jgi:lipoprotein-anchoring transpeptidase ErfK/SrfK
MTAPRPAPANWSPVERLMGSCVVLATLVAVALAAVTLRDLVARNAARAAFEQNDAAIELVQRAAAFGTDSLRAVLDSLPDVPASNRPVIVVSIAENRVWYKLKDSVLFTARVATGSGKELVLRDGKQVVRFETPRGKFTVQRRDSAPAWVPPDWHYAEQANKKKLGLVQLVRGKPLLLADGSRITVVGNDVVRQGADGKSQPLTASDGREIVADGKVVIPPLGTNQRKYPEVLGSFRLYLGDGYALHGTNAPASIGRAVSHGCVRLRNEDIAALYQMTDLGTPVYIY